MIRIIELVTSGWAIFIGFVLFICSFIMQNKGEYDRKISYFRYILLSVILFQLTDMLAWHYSGGTGLVRYLMVRLTNFICYLSIPVILFSTSRFTILLIVEKELSEEASEEDSNSPTDRKICVELSDRFVSVYRIQHVLAAILTLITVLNLFTGCMYTFDDQNCFHVTEGPVILGYYFCCITSLLLIHFLAWKNRKTGYSGLLKIVCLGCLLNEIIALIQVVLYGYPVFNPAFTIAVVLLFAGILRHRAELQREEQRQLEMNRRNLASTRQQMLQLQIQPEFIYNTMAAIQSQILEDQENAYESIGIFSSFLRDTIKFSSKDQLHSIEDELSFAEKYLELAEVRYGEQLDIDFDVRATGFLLPPFTIQPLIENALKHGLKPFNHEGTIRIRTFEEGTEEKKYHIIEVEDNGSGMNPELLNRLPDKTSTHIGILNVKQRIEMACQGKLEVISPVIHSNRPGTIIRITLPH